MTKPIIAITMGDPAGIGPEIIAKALAKPETYATFSPVIFGSERALLRAFGFTGVSFPYENLDPKKSFPTTVSGIGLWNDESQLGKTLALGEVDAACGASAFVWLDTAIQLAKEKKVAAIATAPLNKEALNNAGYHYAGHTEILAEKTGTAEYTLMLIAGAFRVTHVTCHVALRDVSSLLTRKRILSTIRIFNQALTRLDGRPPRIAVCAFNPHAGEAGLFGSEEIQAIRPAIEQAIQEGITAEGPFPSDSIFPQLVGGRYDGAIAMYHDQGHIAFKMANFAFDPVKKEWDTVTGVNVTLGLPIIRTSVDHGTAFDLAGTGKASERSLLDAIEVALRLTGSVESNR
ncbi:MAG: 4-hydroxythreonine-4-phosphate dehydrogenase PdxA [bacterium]|jgi:4-hydroxythreonine-4-phosphate dehydrogenase|nr:4-hydroxythreonine-4-phosphate dehydrogenase PdxA [bacterium]